MRIRTGDTVAHTVRRYEIAELFVGTGRGGGRLQVAPTNVIVSLYETGGMTLSLFSSFVFLCVDCVSA